MKSFTLLSMLLMLCALSSCKKKTTRSTSPSISWSYNGSSFTASSFTIDYQNQFDGYYEPIAVYDDSIQTITLMFGLNNGVAMGNHSVPTYWVFYEVHDKLTLNNHPTIFQNYNINITSANGDYVSGNFSMSNTSGPTLTGNFVDIKSTP